jgi:hypothetical protein
MARGDEQSEAAAAAMSELAPQDVLRPIEITCVAGTWGWRGLLSDSTHWTHPKSPLWRYMATKGLLVRVDRHGRSFTWGTRLAGHQVWRRLFGKKPGVTDWEVGAAGLYDYHRPPTVQPRYHLRGRNVHMICHSHGGNLPYIAASKLGLRINVLVTVSTPIRHDVLSVHGEAGRKLIGRHIHYHSRADRIQRAGQAGDGVVSLAGEHPFADENIELEESCGHSGLLENPFYFDELLTFVEHVHQRHNNPGYLDHRLWVP